jgi:hypothetical protein
VHILGFGDDFPDSTMVTLTRNYRSTQPILDVANTVWADAVHSYAKRLQAVGEGGVLPRLVYCTVAWAYTRKRQPRVFVAELVGGVADVFAKGASEARVRPLQPVKRDRPDAANPVLGEHLVRPDRGTKDVAPLTRRRSTALPSATGVVTVERFVRSTSWGEGTAVRILGRLGFAVVDTHAPRMGQSGTTAS